MRILLRRAQLQQQRRQNSAREEHCGHTNCGRSIKPGGWQAGQQCSCCSSKTSSSRACGKPNRPGAALTVMVGMREWCAYSSLQGDIGARKRCQVSSQAAVRSAHVQAAHGACLGAAGSNKRSSHLRRLTRSIQMPRTCRGRRVEKADRCSTRQQGWHTGMTSKQLLVSTCST